jgi:hypothetical protein
MQPAESEFGSFSHIVITDESLQRTAQSQSNRFCFVRPLERMPLQPPQPPPLHPPLNHHHHHADSRLAAVMKRIVSDDAAADDQDDTESLYSVVSSTSHCDVTDPHASLVTMVQHEPSLSDEYRRQALAYLLNYETMVRQQEAEDMAVLAHIRPCVARLVELMGAPPNRDGWNHHSFLTQEISLSQLRYAVSRLDQQTTQDQHGIPVVVVPEFMTTDRQLMMVLRLLSAAAPTDEDMTLTWAEIIQCYKICIAGMVTLQHLPVAESESESESNYLQGGTTLPHVRARART